MRRPPTARLNQVLAASRCSSRPCRSASLRPSRLPRIGARAWPSRARRGHRAGDQPRRHRRAGVLDYLSPVHLGGCHLLPGVIDLSETLLHIVLWSVVRAALRGAVGGVAGQRATSSCPCCVDGGHRVVELPAGAGVLSDMIGIEGGWVDMRSASAPAALQPVLRAFWRKKEIRARSSGRPSSTRPRKGNDLVGSRPRDGGHRRRCPPARPVARSRSPRCEVSSGCPQPPARWVEFLEAATHRLPSMRRGAS